MIRISARTLWRALLVPAREGWQRWRRSMLLRVVGTTIVVGLSAVALLGAIVTTQIRDGLVDTSIQRILAESAQDSADAQGVFDTTAAVTPSDLQQVVSNQIVALQNSGGDERGVIVLRNPANDSDVPIPSAASDSALVPLVSADMRAAVQTGQAQSWQHVELPDGAPGIVVGSAVSLPEAGDFELYLVYSLTDEAETLALIQSVLTFGAFVLVALVVFMAWTVTLQAVRPVRHAARVASRLAEGLLSERMTVHGRDEMATLARTFNDMAESLQRQITRMEDLSRLQRRFVSDVSHELRTPITTIRMASDVLHEAREDFTPEVSRSAELLSNQLDRFEGLLGDLLEISRIDAGAAQLEFEDVDVARLVHDELAAVQPMAGDMGVELRLWSAKGAHTASIDRPRVARIVRNLVSNAIEYAQGRPVDVLVASTRRGVGVMVRDYGMGMTPQQAERVFDRFWRADAARTRTVGGSGLGLSIAHEDAQLHEGLLEAWGQPGKGASFRLQLPRTSDGLGSRPVMPIVAREEQFAELGERVEVEVFRTEEVEVADART